ncbi:MAG TPA: hypothetical protein DD490_02215 [Acidobacteria bacterium]|nr:hypothetical protein [Acidobacteriota bacterium]
MRYRVLNVQITALALLAALGTVIPATAKVFIPTTTNDTSDGTCDLDCSLRDAITAANQSPGFDAIVLGAGTYRVTGAAGEDLNQSGDLDVLDDLTIVGVSAEQTILEGASDRVVDVLGGTTVEINGVTLRKGRTGTGVHGGGLRNAGRLTLTRVHVTGNVAGGAGGGLFSSGASSDLVIAQSAVTANSAGGVGGGLAVDDFLTLTDSTISGNTAGGTGGGLHTYNNTDADLRNVTITANSAAQAGGLYAESIPFQSTSRPRIEATILAGNIASTDRDCGGAPASAGHNVLGVGGACIDFTAAKADRAGSTGSPVDAKLGALANNGGATPTHALLAGSPALGGAASCTPTDQRGALRPAGTCAVGAFEQTAACLTGGSVLCLKGNRFKVTMTYKGGQGQTGSGQALPYNDGTGTFWFSDPTAFDTTVRVVDGCAGNQRYWVQLSGFTRSEVTTKVTDTVTGATKTYVNPLGRIFRTVLDTNAFPCN